jgi:hypothetical protein
MGMVRRICAGALLAGAVGCGGPSDGLAVTGTVTLDGRPLPDAVVTFYPEGATGGLGGSGTTGPDGTYALTSARGGTGIAAGEYKVIVSRPLRPDGSPPDPHTPPIESDARETLPPIYSDRDASELKATVSKDAKVHDFALQAPRKRK